jgi:uncharacterized membrane protein
MNDLIEEYRMFFATEKILSILGFTFILVGLLLYTILEHYNFAVPTIYIILTTALFVIGSTIFIFLIKRMF